MLSLDFGMKRIGLARAVNRIVLPLEPIVRKNRQQASKEIRDRIMSYGIMKIIIGANPSSRARALHLISMTGFNGEVVFVEEEFTSAEAAEILRDRGYKVRRSTRRDGKLDSVSACIIMQRYLNSDTQSKAIDTASTNQAEGLR